MVEKVDVAPTSPKKVKAPKVKKPKVAPTHPPVSEMVTKAISSLKETKGSSLAAIKKYISSNYKVDVDRLSPFIRKYLKASVTSGSLVQTKGIGANGSFKMGGSAKPKAKATASKPKKSATVKAAKPKKAKAASPKKVAKPKKAAATPKKAAVKKSKPAKKAVSPKKSKAPKAVKPKAKASPKKKAAPKKAKK